MTFARTPATSLAIVMVICAATIAGGSRQTNLDLALDRYSAGDHAAAITGIDRTMTVGALRAAAEHWIQAGDESDRAHRQRVAAAFTLEAVWAATREHEALPAVVRWSLTGPALRSPWDIPVGSLYGVLPMVAWGCDLLSDATGTHPADSYWFLASVGALQDVGASSALLEWRAQPGPGPTWDPLMARELSRGHLVHARAQAPAEARWKLAEALALTDRESRWSYARRPGVLRHAPEPPQALRAVAKRFEALTADAALASEAHLRVAYVDVLRRQWREATARIARVRPNLGEPFLAAVAEYLRGWASERQGDRAEAIASYRRALAFAPGMRNLTTLLATELYLTNQRTEAVELLEALWANPADPPDLIVRFERGDARLVPAYLARLREALK